MAMRGPDFPSRSDTSPLCLFFALITTRTKTANGDVSLRDKQLGPRISMRCFCDVPKSYQQIYEQMQRRLRRRRRKMDACEAASTLAYFRRRQRAGRTCQPYANFCFSPIQLSNSHIRALRRGTNLTSIPPKHAYFMPRTATERSTGCGPHRRNH